MYLTNIHVGIEEQFYKGLPKEIEEFYNVAKKLGDIEEITTSAQSNTVVLNFGKILLFDSGEHQLNSQGKDMLEKEISQIINNKSKAKKYIENKKVIKTIFVKNKIINYIIN